MFADVAYFLERDKKLIDTGMIEINNKFAYDNLEVSIYKQVLKGYLPGETEEIYEGKMYTMISSDVYESNVDVRDTLLTLNKVSFELFICHITDAFAKDLVMGKSDKVKKGLNCNE